MFRHKSPRMVIPSSNDSMDSTSPSPAPSPQSHTSDRHPFHPLPHLHPFHNLHPPHIRVRPPWRRQNHQNLNLQRSESTRTESDDMGISLQTNSSTNQSHPNTSQNHHQDHINPLRGLRRIAGHLFREPDRSEEDLRSTKRRIVQVRRQHDDASIRFTLGFRSRTGWEPIRATRENQDCLVALIPWGPDSRYNLFAALDGHGRYGHICAMFIAQRVVKFLEKMLPTQPEKHQIAHALHRAMLYAEKRLENLSTPSKFEVSGSTGVFVLIHGSTLYCANVGDSRAVVGREKPKTFLNREELHHNQHTQVQQQQQDDYHQSKRADTWSEPTHPHVNNLSKRVPSDHMNRPQDTQLEQNLHQSFTSIQAGPRQNLSQYSYRIDHNHSHGSHKRNNRHFSHHNRNRQHHKHGHSKQTLKPPCKYVPVPVSFDHKPVRDDEKGRLIAAGARVENWDVSSPDGDERVWLPNQRIPGLAVTRSFGDVMLKKYGVFADPEIYALDICVDDRFVVMASDGVFEFMSNEEVIDIVGKWRDNGTPQEAAQELVKVATDRWIKDDSVIDDISCVVVFMDVLNPQVSGPCEPFHLKGTIDIPEDHHSHSGDSSPSYRALPQGDSNQNPLDPNMSNGTDFSYDEIHIHEGNSTNNMKELQYDLERLRAEDSDFDISRSYGDDTHFRTVGSSAVTGISTINISNRQSNDQQNPLNNSTDYSNVNAADGIQVFRPNELTLQYPN